LPNFISDPNAPLLRLNASDTLTLRQAYEGIHVFGAPGSGKTSGSGQTLARAFIRAGMGGLVLCSKPSEIERWQQYAAENGRENSVFIFDREQGFNFIEYALHRYGVDSITNVVGILMRVLDDARKARGKSGDDNSPFWDESIEEILKHAIPVLYSATGTVTIQGILDFAIHAPVGAEKWKEVAKNIEGNPTALALRTMSAAPLHPLPPEECKRMVSFWMTGEWQKHDDRTRGNILSSLTSRLGLFRHGMLRNCFCGKTTWIPEMMFHGCITIAGIPVQANETEGRLAQMVLKYMTQLAVESRNALPERHRERPIFIWVDEAHRFISVKDEQFLAECRESRCCCCFLSQGLPSYYAALGERETKRVDGLIGKFSTQLFHQNGCHHTNEFASKIIGRGLQMRRTVGQNRSTSHSTTKGQSRGASRGWSQGMSRGTNSGQSWGLNKGTNRGESESASSTRGMNLGGGGSTTEGKSGGYSSGSNRSSSSAGGGSSGSNSSSNSGWNKSKSNNSSWSQSVGSSETMGRNSGMSQGFNLGKNFGRNESFNAGVSESQNWSLSESETWGETVGESISIAEQMDNLIEPNYFATALLAGGEHRIVTALLFRAGARFSNGQNFMLVGFRQ
jgi:hypothetical protein